MRITTYIFISFFFILILFSITTYINFRLSQNVYENNRYFAKSSEIMKQSARFQRNVLNMVSGLRGYLISGERGFVTAYDSAEVENDYILAELDSLVDDSSQIKLLAEIRLLNQLWVDGYAAPLKQAKSLASVSDSNLMAYNRLYRNKILTGDEKEIQANLQQKFKEFTNREYSIRKERSERISTYAETTGTISVMLSVLSLSAGLLVVVFLIRRVRKRISKMVSMADSISSGNYQATLVDKRNDELTSLVHSLNHMAASLAHNISELETKNKELNQFAHIVSHDLKGPLRGIDNVLNWIEEDHKEELSPKVDNYLQTIKGRVSRAENLIQGILSYARIDSETMSKETVDLNAMIDEIVLNMPYEANIKIEVESLPLLNSERIPLFQVFSNLISNAIKYNDKPKGRVHIRFKEFPQFYEFSVSDNGPGIAPHYHERIFVIFQTLTDRDSFESTGVGLAIVKKILDARKETIRVESEPGAGTSFIFTWKK